MTNAYLGILTLRGLEQVCEETEHAARFLARRCHRRGALPAALCWATLDRQDAQIIEQLIRLGLFAPALWRLNADARQLGTLPPACSAGDAA